MTVLLALILRALALDPVEACAAGARGAGHPELAAEVLAICRTETAGCRRVGVHRGHVPRVPGATFRRAASGLDPEACELHRGGAPERWGIRGPHGHAAAFAVGYLGPCVAPEALDVPIVSAWAAAKRLAALRQRYGRRTARERAHAWRHGVGCRCEVSGP